MIDGIRRRLRVLRARFGPWVDREMALIDQAYRRELDRPLDPVGAESWERRLRAGEVVSADATAFVRASPEYLLGPGGLLHQLHEARRQWVARLDPFDTILDIGGSSPDCPDGALIELGYGHRPRELHIVDRPEDEQFHGRPRYDQREDRRTDWGVVAFHHGRAEEVGEFGELADRTFDCVFMGQTIEHIEVDALPEVLSFVRTHLAPGGRFVFDTPNRDLTRLLMSDAAMLSADHTHEYTPAEMDEVLSANGFAVTKTTGILPMPGSAARGTFDVTETETGEPLVDDPSASFVFAFECTPVEGGS